MVIEADGARELCVHPPGKTVDLLIRSDLRTIAEIWAGDTDILTAKRAGRLHVSGQPEMIKTLAMWLRPSLLAHIRPHPEPLRV